MHESKQVKQLRLRCQRSSTLGWRKVWSKSMKGPVILKRCLFEHVQTSNLGWWPLHRIPGTLKEFWETRLKNHKQSFRIISYELFQPETSETQNFDLGSAGLQVIASLPDCWLVQSLQSRDLGPNTWHPSPWLRKMHRNNPKIINCVKRI